MVRRVTVGLAVCLVTILSTVLSPALVNAQVVSETASVNVTSGCISTVNGIAGTNYIDVTPGSSVSLVVTNQDSLVAQKIRGTGVASGTKVAANSGKTSLSLGVINSPETISFTPVPISSKGTATNYCPTGSNPTPSNLVINPVSASLSCSLNGSNWQLSGNLSGNTTSGVAVYTGSTNLQELTQSGAISIDQAAGITSQIFSVIDGLNYSNAKLTTLATTTCTGNDTSSASSASSSPPSTTVDPGTTVSSPPAVSTGDTPSPAVGSPITPGDSSDDDDGAKPVDSAAAAPALANNNAQTAALGSNKSTMLIYTGTGVIAVLVIVTVLASTGIWTTPRTIAANGWNKFNKISRRRSLRKLP